MTNASHEGTWQLRAIGYVRSSLRRLEDCPHQGSGGAPDAWLEISPDLVDGLDGIASGSEVVVITWFHEARRDMLKVHPRRNPQNPLCGVFATRSPNRPNPIGLHRVQVVEIKTRGVLRVHPLEALDGTPIIDIKPVLPGSLDS
jgi:tRNA-Thr(GGU) m(6)t(6)A37 methyltransferase TsaA